MMITETCLRELVCDDSVCVSAKAIFIADGALVGTETGACNADCCFIGVDGFNVIDVDDDEVFVDY
jgi:hypothetical protein